MEGLFDGVWYDNCMTRGVGYKYGDTPLESMVSQEGINFLNRAIAAAPEQDQFDVMRRVGEYVIEAFPVPEKETKQCLTA